MANLNLSERFKAERIKWTDDEMKLVLAYYFFIYGTNTREKDYKIFAADLRKMTGNNRSDGSVGVRFGNYISIDPSKESSGFQGGYKKCLSIWKECINDDRTPKDSFILLFMTFIEKYAVDITIYLPFIVKYSNYRSYNHMIKTDDEFNKIHISDVVDKIKTKKININNLLNETIDVSNYSTVIKRKRSADVAAYTRNRANGICDLCGNSAPFFDKDGVPYLESHHVITLAAGGPDVIYNTVALCPNCHRKIHMLDSVEDFEFLKKVIYKYLLDENDIGVIEKFEHLFNE